MVDYRARFSTWSPELISDLTSDLISPSGDFIIFELWLVNLNKFKQIWAAKFTAIHEDSKLPGGAHGQITFFNLHQLLNLIRFLQKKSENETVIYVA